MKSTTAVADTPASAPAPGRQWFTVADGKRLQALRRERGLTQQMLAQLAGLSAATIARLESESHASCRGRTLGRLAAVLGIDPKELIFDAQRTACARRDHQGDGGTDGEPQGVPRPARPGHELPGQLVHGDTSAPSLA